MARISAAAEIDRPISAVWESLTDLHNAKDWSTEVVETSYSGPLRLGGHEAVGQEASPVEMIGH